MSAIIMSNLLFNICMSQILLWEEHNSGSRLTANGEISDLAWNLNSGVNQ